MIYLGIISFYLSCCDSLEILNLWTDMSDENSVKAFNENFTAISSNIVSSSSSLFSTSGTPVNIHQIFSSFHLSLLSCLLCFIFVFLQAIFWIISSDLYSSLHIQFSVTLKSTHWVLNFDYCIFLFQYIMPWPFSVVSYSHSSSY